MAHQLAARAVLVATGSRPTRYPGVAFDDPDVYDSDEIYALRTVPKGIVIVGGGPVGVEFAVIVEPVPALAPRPGARSSGSKRPFCG